MLLISVSRSSFYGIYILQLIHSARVYSNISDFNYRHQLLTAKFQKQSYENLNSKFYRRNLEMTVKYNVCLKILLQQSIPEPLLYGNLVYKFKRIDGK